MRLEKQYADKFENTINQHQWDKLKEGASSNLAENERAHPEVVKHWQAIVDGKLPFGFTIKED